MKRAGGFTLVELMVTVALLALLTMLAGPLTAAWSNSAQVRDAEGLLNQGLGRAKANALRNRYGMIDSQPSALLCLSQGGQLSLHEAASATSPASCTSPQLWSAQLPQRVSVQSSGAAFSCLAFDTRGLPTSVSGCSTSQTFALSAGSEHVTVTFK